MNKFGVKELSIAVILVRRPVTFLVRPATFVCSSKELIESTRKIITFQN